ncbi:MAG: ComF family protein [Rhodospirillaceae bacterium]|jgi:ComF family protein|nr:ComF family protein [Rhodospirillaceae bacterium]MBT5455476.1 ComF family protein [Rhodospirillaceae bacterium]
MTKVTETRRSAIPAWLRRAAEGATGLLLPRRCLACGTPVDGQGALCAACWPEIQFLSPPLCSTCGYPFDYDPGAGVLCGACTAQSPVYNRARAVFVYDDASRGPLLAFKHADRTDAAPSFARLMVQAGSEIWPDAPMIVPVPLHRRRLVSRRYNQSALLAHSLAAETGLTSVSDLLVRTRHTPTQGGLSASGRRRNVRGAFAVRRDSLSLVRDAHVLLVDDVFTTGATVETCATTLLRVGARAVDVLTLARVVRPTLL